LLFMAFFEMKLYQDQRHQSQILTMQVSRLDDVVAARAAEAKAANRASVESCFSRASQGPGIRRVLHSLEASVIDPAGQEALRDFDQLNALNTPTFRECRQLAVKLKVKSPKEVR